MSSALLLKINSLGAKKCPRWQCAICYCHLFIIRLLWGVWEWKHQQNHFPVSSWTQWKMGSSHWPGLGWTCCPLPHPTIPPQPQTIVSHPGLPVLCMGLLPNSSGSSAATQHRKGRETENACLSICLVSQGGHVNIAGVSCSLGTSPVSLQTALIRSSGAHSRIPHTSACFLN